RGGPDAALSAGRATPAAVQARPLQRVHPEARPGGRSHQCSSHSPRDSEPWLRRRLYHPERLHETLRPQRQAKFTIRYETEPGEEAQVDWGYFGRVQVFGVQRHLWCFAMVLSWSRMLYIEFVWETHEAVLQRCHMNAFDYFQG